MSNKYYRYISTGALASPITDYSLKTEKFAGDFGLINDTISSLKIIVSADTGSVKLKADNLALADTDAIPIVSATPLVLNMIENGRLKYRIEDIYLYVPTGSVTFDIYLESNKNVV